MKNISKWVGLAVVLIATVALSTNVEVKYSGPDNQGDVIYWSRQSGITNLVMGTNGVKVFTVQPGAGIVFTNASLTITRQAVASVTNLVATSVTNSWVYLNATTNLATNTIVTVTYAIQAAAVAAVTNVVLSNP